MSTNHYPNFNENETRWLVQSAALRPDANVDDLIHSFIAVFPDRAKHDGLTEVEIHETLISRINDLIYRKDRGYAEIIAEKRQEFQEMFSTAFAVLNPLSLLNYYEQTFTNPKSEPSDKFKAILEAEKLKARLFPPPTPRQQGEIDRQLNHMKKRRRTKEMSYSRVCFNTGLISFTTNSTKRDRKRLKTAPKDTRNTNK